MTQNEQSQQSILLTAQANIDLTLADIKSRITNGCKSLSEEYSQFPEHKRNDKPFTCFSLLEEYQKQIESQCKHQPQLYLPLALTTLTAILQKSFEFTAHYVFLTAEPNANKTTTLNTISNSLSILELNQSPQWPRSYPAFYQQIGATNSTGLVMLVDEMFKKMRSCYVEKDRADSDVFEKIVNIYENDEFQAPLVKFEIPKVGEESQERKNIKHVRFSLLGTGTNGEFHQLLKSSQFTESGWLSRMGLFRLYQSKDPRKISQVLKGGKNIFKIGSTINESLKKLKEWSSIEIDVKKREDNEFIDKKLPRRFVRLKFYCLETEPSLFTNAKDEEDTGNPWDTARDSLTEAINICTEYFKKQGYKKYTSLFEELAGDRLIQKVTYYAQLLWLTDAILCPDSPMAIDLNAYLNSQNLDNQMDQKHIYLPYTYFDMGIQIVKLMVLNLYSIILEGLGDEDGTDAHIQKSIMNIFHNHESLCVHGLSPNDVARLITNQYRSTLYRQARRENLNELCNDGYITFVVDKNHGKPFHGARYIPTKKGWSAFPKPR